MLHLLVSSGEVSGDLQGSLLVQALFEEAKARGIALRITALGGRLMREAGAQLLGDTTAIGAIGLWEALPFILPTLKLQRRVRRWLRRERPDGVVLIDYMGPNASLGMQLKRLDPERPIAYYIAPQEWAYRIGEGGSTRLIGFSDRILAVFPQEARFYAARGARVTWVGHPLLDTLPGLPGRAQARAALGLAEDARLLLLLPASRRQELRYLLPPLAEAAARLQRRLTGLRVVLPVAQEAFTPAIQAVLDRSGLDAELLSPGQAKARRELLLAAADLALTKSGTVNLELALRGVPQVVGYRLNPITAWLAKHLLRFSVAFISPVNLVMDDALVPELLQDHLSADAVEALAFSLLSERPLRQRMDRGYRELRRRLGEPGVTRRAAAAVLDMTLAAVAKRG
ncbi:MAG: lipid-A-disaccharide synthase [Aphanocapsa feldmannii 288cV]|nr:MAG: lipid-A-disaccharide synthase [Aphanocapsa feldmannii 288cV]